MAETIRYVKTTDARQAVEGRETDILRRLGVHWQDGQHGKITCPFPGHGGANDWRWDARKHKGYCTCKKGFSIFDAVMEINGVNIEEAKIICCEMVDRTDLIREKTEGGQYQATDAESLMKAPAERRDDMLCRAYVAHRLGAEPDAVLMPATRTIGIKELGYYDPPKGKSAGKPVHVGDFPCAVFEQIDAQGRRHAHRIYVAPEGAGKADLGMASNGTVRDAKKSAKRIGEESTAGRAVIWGDAERAPWCIIAEGIETAAAVAHAFRQEIQAGAAYVAAGINAGGIEAFVPWPETKRVTVAADRDEAAKISRPNPTRRGEEAARKFGIRNRERVAVAYALAGEPGTASDWLDVHAARGPEAVRAGILAAVAFVATQDEIDEEERRHEDIDELARVARDYPLPELDGLSLTYQRTKSGRIRVHQRVKVGDEAVLQPIASPFGVAARLRYLDQGESYGLRLVVEDMGGQLRQIDVSRDAFARQGAAETRSMLFAAGLRTEGDGEMIAVKALKAADPQAEIAVVRRPGWHTLEGVSDKLFGCPSGEIIGLPSERALELSTASRISETVAVGGTLEGWKEAVATACRTPRCEHWTIGTIAGFCGPLIELCGLGTCMINLSGMTSGGKTTAQRLAVSAWSRAALDQRDSLLQSSRATANGMEGMAARSNGTVLALDELGHVHGKELGRVIYSLSSGTGKNRMMSDARMRSSHTWSTFAILSAEKSLEEKIRADGAEWAGGMAVRIPDIDISGVDRAVDQAVLDRIKAVDRHFGHAGPAFVRALIAAGYHRQGHDLYARIDQTALRIATTGNDDRDGKHTRAALPFAVMAVAGALAQQFGLLPADIDIAHAIRWAWGRFMGSTDADALDPEQQAIDNLRSWIAAHWGSSIQPTVPDDNGRAPSREAKGWFDDGVVYIPRRNIVEAAGGALKEVEIARSLDRRDFIAKRHAADCMFVGYIPKIGSVKAYALKRSAFGRSNQSEPAFGVYQGGRA